jgi:methyl-accepting chemotaxis protein
MQFKTKILAVSTFGILLTGLTVIVVILCEQRPLDRQVAGEMDAQARSECSKIAKDIYQMLCIQNESIKKKIRSNLAIAREWIEVGGGISFSDERVSWNAVNQFTNRAEEIELPKMLLGGQWLGQNTRSDEPSPFVDKIQTLTSASCTVFQRANEQGDMLRVCTNVKKEDGSRAIGTYIPAVNPDGKPNPVIHTIMQGETYVGRAFVVNTWCLTAYEPILDSQKKVVGLLYVGIKQEDQPELRQGIMNIVAGKTGYAYVLGGAGDEQGKYIISYKGQRDGENLWDAKDADGNHFIQSLVAEAESTKNGGILERASVAGRSPQSLVSSPGTG